MNRLFRKLFLVLAVFMLNPLVCVFANETNITVMDNTGVNLTEYKGSMRNYVPLWERNAVSTFSGRNGTISGDSEPTMHDIARVCYDEIDENSPTVSLRSVTANDYNAIHGASLRNRVDNPKFVNSESSHVSQFDGSLQLNYTEISLPGRNGLDLTLGHFFQNEHCQEEVLYVDGEYCMAPVTYFNKRYALGLGWSFSFPSVELRKRSDGEYQAYYHDGSGNVYRSNYKDSTKNEDGEDYYNGYLIYATNLDNYYTDNVRFLEKDRSYERDGVKSQYSFKRADNTKEYFAEDGRLISIKDRFDNEIKFDYTTYPAESVIPFYAFHKYDLSNDWIYNSNYLKYDGDNTPSTSIAETQYGELDEFCNEYYISLLYEAVYNFANPYDGSFEVYCDLYSENSELLESILIDEVTPEICDEAFLVDGYISLDDYYFDEEPTKAKIRIKVKSTENDILFTDIRLSPCRSLMSRITDTIGRTIDFEYQGDLYTRYEETTRHPLIATVKAPDGQEIRSIYYSRDVRTATLYYEESLERHFYYFLRSWNDGENVYAVDYDYMEGKGSLTYARTSTTYPYYTINSRPVVVCAEYRNSNTYFEYEKVSKWVDNRPMGSSEAASLYNTCFFDAWRVVKKADTDKHTSYSDESAYNIYTYDYNDGFYTDETAYGRHTVAGAEPGYLNPKDDAKYIVKIKNPSGSIEKYEYTSHFFDSGFRRKWEIILPLADKKTVYESSDSDCDYVVQEYTYEDNYAIISPTEIRTEERIGGVIREYYNKIEYDSNSCLPIMQTLPLTEDELYETPATKTIETEYQTFDNRMFLPKKTVYYQSEDSDALTVEKIYDELGRVISEVDANGEMVNYEYSTKYAWLPARVYFNDPENTGDTQRIVETLYSYSDNYGFGPTSERIKYDSNSNSYAVTRYEYEPNYGNIAKVTKPDGSITRYEYDNMGRKTAEYYPPYLGIGSTPFYSHKKYSYDDVLCEYRWLFKVSETLYSTINSNYELTGWEDEFSNTNIYYYDDYGNLHYQYVGNIEEIYTYDKAGRVSQYSVGDDIEKEGNTLTYSYDGFNRVTSVADYDGNTQNARYGSLETEYTFVPAGSSVAENHYVENYDIYGNKISESIYPNGRTSPPFTTYYEYDLSGNITKITDAQNNVTAFVYDRLDNPVEIIKPDGSRILYDYTKWNTVKSTTQYEENQPYSVHETFDNRGLVVSHRQAGSDIDTKPLYNYYDASGRLSYSTEPNGTAYSYSYDDLGNNTYSERGSIYQTMTYNPFGLLVNADSMENGKYDSWVLYEYDGSGTMPISKIEDSGTIWYSYDSYNNLSRLYFGTDEYKIDYDRDQLNRICRVEANDEKDFIYEYYPDGMIKTLSYPDANIVTSYTYDNANQITKMETKKDSEILASYSYEYDGLGNITSVSGSQTSSYTYDELNRLKTVTENGYTATYEYDSRNNIIKETRDNGYLKTYEYTGDNKLKKTVENGVETIFEYDLNGNMIKRGEDVFAYDSLNRLVYSCVDGEVSEYDIGINGLRWRKKANNHRINYLYDDAGNLLAEDRNYFVVCNNKILAKTMDGSYYYYIYNAHGDVVMIVDEEGNIKNTYQYDAWGSVVSQTETIANNHKYAGEYQDLDSELIYLRNRYYDPSIGRFITEDPAMDGLNWYMYCGDNPVVFVDPWGLKAEGEVFGLGCGTYSDVLRVQEYLNSKGYKGANNKSLTEDGIFGKNTVYAVKQYQADYGLTVDGLVGDDTWTSMGFEFDEDTNITLSKKTKPNFTSKKDQGNSRKGSDDRQKSGNRERNIGHKDGEEHSRVPKGNNGVKRISGESVRKATGWALVGTVTYFVISESLRIIFPPRNFIPVP